MGAKNAKPRVPAVKGRVAQVDLCPDEGFVLSIGPISLWLSAATALDVVETLARALVLEAARLKVSPVAERRKPSN